MKKRVSLFLAIAMLLAATCLFGVAQAAKAEDPIKVVIICPNSGVDSDEKAYKMVQEKILQETGVLVEAIRLSGTNDYDKINMMLTSGDQIDVFWGNWMEYSELGAVQPLNDYMDCIPNLIKVWENFNPDAFAICTDAEGNIWGFPRNVNRVFYQTFVRQDWLDKLGMEGPTNLDELNAYLYAVKELDPYGNGETIPMILRGSNLDTLLYHFLGGFTEYGNSNWMDEDGSIKPYYLQKGYVDFLKQCAQWYADGIIHKENFSWDVNTVQQYIASGRVAASGAYSTDVTAQYVNLKANYPGAVWYDCIEGMEGPNGNKMESLIKANATAGMINANSDEEHIRAALKVIDWMYSDWGNFKIGMSGIQGVHWDYDDSYENARELHITKQLEADSAYNYNFWFGIGLPMEMDCVTYDADGQRNMHNEYMGHQGNISAAVMPFDININYNTKEISEACPGYNDIKTALQEEQIKFVMGVRSIDEWDSFIDSLYKMGLQDYIDEVTRQYNAAVGK